MLFIEPSPAAAGVFNCGPWASASESGGFSSQASSGASQISSVESEKTPHRKKRGTPEVAGTHADTQRDTTAHPQPRAVPHPASGPNSNETAWWQERPCSVLLSHPESTARRCCAKSQELFPYSIQSGVNGSGLRRHPAQRAWIPTRAAMACSSTVLRT